MKGVKRLKKDLATQLNKFYQMEAHIYNDVRHPVIDSFEEKIEFLKKIGKITLKSKIAEIGVGTGKYLNRIVTDTGSKGIGFDISFEMLNIAKRNSCNNVHFVCSDAIMMPVKSNYYDMVYAVNSIHQIEDVQSLFRESYRVLKSNGKFLIITPNIKRLKEFLLYKAYPSLYEFERERMPTLKLLKIYGEKVCFTIMGKIVPNPNGSYIHLNQFLYCLNHRFLSCLALLSDDELKEVIREVESFAIKNNIQEVSPYTYMIVVFLKESK